MTSPTQCDVRGESLPVERDFRQFSAPPGLTAQAAEEPGPGVSPDPIAFRAEMPEHLGGLLDGQPGEVIAASPARRACGSSTASRRGPRRRPAVSPPAVDRRGRPRPGRPAAAPPPCWMRRLRRAFSTRMRRMASAAAPKKWPRLFHGLGRHRPPGADRLRGPGPSPGASGRASRGRAARRPACAARRRPAATADRRRPGSPWSIASRIRVTSFIGGGRSGPIQGRRGRGSTQEHGTSTSRVIHRVASG